MENVTVFTGGLLKTSKMVKNISAGRQMLSFACILSGFRCENRMTDQSSLNSCFPTSQQTDKLKQSHFLLIRSAWICPVCPNGISNSIKDGHKNFGQASKAASLLIFVWSSVRKSNSRPQLPSQLFPNVKKPETFKQITLFLHMFFLHKFVTVSWKALWKAAKTVKNKAIGH